MLMRPQSPGLLLPNRRRFVAGLGATSFLGLSTTPAFATPALVSHASAAGVGTATAGPINTVGADLIILSYSGNWNGVSNVVSDSAGNTYTTIAAPTDGNNPNLRAFLDRCNNPVASPMHSFTVVQAPGGPIGLTVAAFSLSGAVDQSNSNGTIGVTTQPGSITPSRNFCLVVSNFAMVGGTTVSINSGFTITDQIAPGTTYGAALAYLVQNPAAAVNPTWTLSGGGGFGTASVIASFLPASPPVTKSFFHSFPP